MNCRMLSFKLQEHIIANVRGATVYKGAAPAGGGDDRWRCWRVVVTGKTFMQESGV